MADIGKRIKERRESLKMTQEELAQKLGYKNKSTIGKIETGINDIVQSKVPEFANALNTSVAYLMGWINDKDEDGLINYFDDTLEDAILFLEKNGYTVLQTDSSSDDTVIIKNKNKQIIKTTTNGDLVRQNEKIRINNLPKTIENLLDIESVDILPERIRSAARGMMDLSDSDQELAINMIQSLAMKGRRINED